MLLLGAFLSTTLPGLAAGASGTVTCENGAEVKAADFCAFFHKRTQPGSVPVDPRIATRIPSRDPLDPPVRSFALVVGVSSYPRFHDTEDQTLPPAAADTTNLVSFLDAQKFDEVIVLNNEAATKDNIDYFLGDYLNKQADTYRMRSRILFAFSGHGAPPDRPGESGSLVLSRAEDAKDYPNLYNLGDLAPKLKTLGGKSYHFIALLGSCFSGGIFASSSAGGDNNIFPKAPGAHAVSATKSDDLAYAWKDKPGSIFFNELVSGVTSGNGDRDYSGWAQEENGNLHLVGGGIVRLGALTSYISGAIDHLSPNPKTNTDFPQIMFGRVTSGTEAGGAFFFLGPDRKDTIVVSANDPNDPIHTASAVTLSLAAGTNAVAGHPEIKLYNAPDTYPVQGIDISHYDGKIDWSTVAKQNIQFAYVKATQGVGYVDPTFSRNWEGSRAAGLAPGAYHVFSFCKPAKDQFDLIQRTVPKDAGAMPIAIDLQWVNGPTLSGEGGCNDISRIRQSIKDLEAMLRRWYGKPPVIHGFTSTFKDVIDDSFADNAIWLQDYKKTPGVQAGPVLLGKQPWSIWQFSSNAVIPGIDGHVDVNAYFGSKEQFGRFTATGRSADASRVQ